MSPPFVILRIGTGAEFKQAAAPGLINVKDPQGCFCVLRGLEEMVFRSPSPLAVQASQDALDAPRCVE